MAVSEERRGDAIIVEAVGRQASGRDRSSSHTEISLRGCIELAHSSGPALVGDWHVEPGGHASGTPSHTDERAWTGLRGGQGAWLGLIITESGADPVYRMIRPPLHA